MSILIQLLLADRGMQYDELYPNNLIIKDDIIYAGMRGKVYKYNLLTKKQDWLQTIIIQYI